VECLLLANVYIFFVVHDQDAFFNHEQSTLLLKIIVSADSRVQNAIYCTAAASNKLSAPVYATLSDNKISSIITPVKVQCTPATGRAIFLKMRAILKIHREFKRGIAAAQVRRAGITQSALLLHRARRAGIQFLVATKNRKVPFVQASVGDALSALP